MNNASIDKRQNSANGINSVFRHRHKWLIEYRQIGLFSDAKLAPVLFGKGELGGMTCI
ncbi:Uncharacterised protein [Salmonella enterica subsp. enterica serovar Gallinarum]|nr:Uncharacterised protein [Salmonella enterica subsp. enterica serovar Gallinarum]